MILLVQNNLTWDKDVIDNEDRLKNDNFDYRWIYTQDGPVLDGIFVTHLGWKERVLDELEALIRCGARGELIFVDSCNVTPFVLAVLSSHVDLYATRSITIPKTNYLLENKDEESSSN